MKIKPNAIGSGYYTAHVGDKTSNHTAEREALQTCVNAILDGVDSTTVYYDHSDYKIVFNVDGSVKDTKPDNVSKDNTSDTENQTPEPDSEPVVVTKPTEQETDNKKSNTPTKNNVNESLTPKEPKEGWFQTDLSKGEELLKGVGDNVISPTPETININDFSPNPDRKIAPRNPVNPWPHFEPEKFDIPKVEAKFTIDNGTVLTITDAKEGLNAFLNSDGTKHPHLRLDVYDDGVIPENPYITTDTDYKGVLELSVDGKQVAKQTLVLVRGCGSRPIRQGFKQHAFHPVNPMALPAFDYSYGSQFDGSHWYQMALDVASKGLHDPGMMWVDDMSEVGGHTYLGAIPGWDMGYVLCPNDQNATSARAGADSGMAYNIRIRDPDTDLPVNIIDRPNWTLFWPHLGMYGNPIQKVKNSLKSDMPGGLESAHLVGFGIVAALATGSRMDRMNMAFYGNYAAGLWADENYRGRGKALIDRNQLREEAWLWRTLAYSAIAAPEELIPYFDQVMKNNEDRYESWYGENGTRKTPLHIDPDNNFYPSDHDGGMGFSTWEHYYKGMVLNLLVRLGFTTLASSRDYIVTMPIQFSAQACFQSLADYTKHVKAEQGGPIVFGNWHDVMRYEQRNTDNSGLICGHFAHDGNPDHVGDIQAGAARSYDYPAWMQGIIAAGDDSELNGGSELWDVFNKYPTTKTQWGDSPNWNIVPSRLSNCPHDMTQKHYADPKCFASTDGLE